MKKILPIFGLAFFALVNSSCLGAQADISIRADGSGRIALEYRVSQMLESMGRLDGNEGWPAVPVGRADLERSVARIPGLSLRSFSSREAGNSAGGRDLVTRAVLEFRDLSALLAFLDSSGSAASLAQRDGKNTLRIVLLENAVDDAQSIDGDLLSLMREISAGYEICFDFNLPRSATLSASPPQSISSARIVPAGRKVSFAIGMGDLVGLEDGLILEIGW
ncbi:MAG: hypothetical protein LBI06_01590 [Treponema sp.]|jgi:hypothetical protein|nr:hypothetical protein [Treponema sp.]